MKKLQRILCMQDKELGAYLIQNLKKYYKNVETDRDNYIYAKGTSAICLVAHIDTVRGKTDEPVKLSITRNVIRNIKGVLGADDRAGVYGILEVIKACSEFTFPMPSVLFTNYEESGGRGVKKFVASNKFNPEGLTLLVELDRKGCNEFVYYSHTLPKPIKDYVESFGFKEERGSYSDIADLTNEYHIPSVNLSIGYYSQHTNNERLHYDEVLLTVDRVVDMCAEPPEKLHEVTPPLYKNSWKGSGGTYGGYHGGYGAYGDGYGDAYDYYEHNRAANKTFEANRGTSVTTKLAGATGNLPTKVEESVSSIILELKEEIRTELLTVYSLDTVMQKFFNHEKNLEIIERLGDIESEFYANVTLDLPSHDSFANTWNSIITQEFYKTNPAAAATAVHSRP